MLALATLLTACAQPNPSDTSTDKRMSVIKGTAEGITLLPARRAPADAASASGASGAPGASTAAAPVAAASAPASGGLFRALPPPTGRPLTQQKKLDDPGQGIPLPTAGSTGGTAR
jgi:hypothetical protein